MLKIWRLKAPSFLQALHFVISTGCSVSPFIVDVFMSDTNELSNSLNVTGNYTTDIMTKPNISPGDFEVVYNSSQTNKSYSSASDRDRVFHSDLLYPYMITAFIFVVAGVIFAWTLILDIWHFRKGSMPRRDSFLKQQKENVGPVRNKPILVMLLIYTMIYGGLESTYGGWVLAFSVKYLHFTFGKAALIATTFWASFAGGRAISIVTAKMFSSESVTCVSLSISVVALLVNTVACTLHPSVMWVCSVVLGLSFAPLFGNCISYSHHELNISARATTAFVFFLFLGFMAMPALVGFLFARYTPMLFLHVLTAGSICITLIFFSTIMYKRFVKKNRDN